METKNYFLGSVGRVEAFREGENGLELAFVSKTLTDSGINTSITADDIRAGQGAPIVTRFYHDASVEITLTDVMFKRAYVEAQLGAKFEAGGEAYQSELEKKCEHPGELTLDKEPLALGSGCNENPGVTVWYAKAGSSDWKIATASAGSKTIHGDFEENEKYCVRYLAVDDTAYVAKIFADIIPEELHLIITVPLYAGDACSASTGKAAGEVQFDIPRFRLNGSQDFAAAMSSNQTMSLAGSALASQLGCDTSAILYTMRVKYNGESVANDYKALEVLDESKVNDQEPVVYGIKPDNSAVLLNNALLTFTPELVGGKWQTGNYTIAFGELEEEAVVAAE